MKLLSLVLVLSGLSLGWAQAQILKNGDFSNGRTHWQGTAGTVVTLDDVPQLQVVLNKTITKDLKQRLKLPAQYKGGCAVTVVLKTSDDFALNEKAPCWSSGLNWKIPSRHVNWSRIVNPKADFYMRLDGENYNYVLRALKVGGDWQTITGNIDFLGFSQQSQLVLVFPAGTGTIWVKSVELELE